MHTHAHAHTHTHARARAHAHTHRGREREIERKRWGERKRFPHSSTPSIIILFLSPFRQRMAIFYFAIL